MPAIYMPDIIIIGAGPAGLVAAIYAARKALDTLVVSIDIGGQANLASAIENYPGVRSIAGWKLMTTFKEQAEHFGARFVAGKVLKLAKLEQGFELTLASGERYQAKAVIIASGAVPRTLGVPGEERFLGRGISTCATCDGPLFKKKDVAVIGGGNAALEAAAELAKFARKVYVVHRREQFRADEITIAKVKALPNVKFILNAAVSEFRGQKVLASLILEDTTTKSKQELKVDGAFLEIGYITESSWLKGLVRLNKAGEIVVDSRCATSQPGIFAAGDVTTVPFKQVVISAGEGAKAALEAHRWLTGGKGVSIDWV